MAERSFPAELRGLYETAESLGADVDHLAAVVGFESGFDPGAVNPSSGASGLIQFMPPHTGDVGSAVRCGTTVEALRQMKFLEQLPFVVCYLAPFRSRLTSLENTYLAVFYPAAIGRAGGDVIAKKGSQVYEQNALFDRGKKGWITKDDITATIRAYAARARGRVEIPDTPSSPPGSNLILLGAAVVSAGAFWYFRKHGVGGLHGLVRAG